MGGGGRQRNGDGDGQNDEEEDGGQGRHERDAVGRQAQEDHRGLEAPHQERAVRTIAEATELTKKQVASVFDTLGQVLAADLAKGHVVNVGGLMKVTVTRKPATKEREGINPFTGEKQIFKAKPARNVVKVRPLKTLKSMV